MIVLWALLGLGMGSLLHWAAQWVSYWASRTAVPAEPLFRPSWWQWLRSIGRTSRRLEPRAPFWVGLGAEAFTALSFASFWRVHGLSWRLPMLLAGVAFFILIALVDLRCQLVPGIVLLVGTMAALLYHCLVPTVGIGKALLGSAVGLSPFLLGALLKPGSIGGGDVKLAALIGLMAGFPQVLWPISIAIMAGGIGAIVFILTRYGHPEDRVPYAPFLCLGAVVSLLYNPLSEALLYR